MLTLCFFIRPIVGPHAVIVALSVPAKTSLRMYKINSFQYLVFLMVVAQHRENKMIGLQKSKSNKKGYSCFLWFKKSYRRKMKVSFSYFIVALSFPKLKSNQKKGLSQNKKCSVFPTKALFFPICPFFASRPKAPSRFASPQALLFPLNEGACVFR